MIGARAGASKEEELNDMSEALLFPGQGAQFVGMGKAFIFCLIFILYLLNLLDCFANLFYLKHYC